MPQNVESSASRIAGSESQTTTPPQRPVNSQELSGRDRRRRGSHRYGWRVASSRRATFVALVLLVFLVLTSCGDKARYTGRVESVQGQRLCLGPNTSDPVGTCGTAPPDVELPSAGTCMSLTGDHVDGVITWNPQDLEPVSDSECTIGGN